MILAILAAIAIPYTLGYIDDSKNSKDHLMATKYYHLGDYYQDKAYESVSNIVEAVSRDDEHAQRIKEVYHKIVSCNKQIICGSLSIHFDILLHIISKKTLCYKSAFLDKILNNKICNLIIMYNITTMIFAFQNDKFTVFNMMRNTFNMI